MVRLWYNQIKELNTSDLTQLTGLYCNNNELTNLDVKKSTSLNELYCGWNKLEELDVTGLNELSYLGIMWNEIATIDLSDNQNLSVYPTELEQRVHLEREQKDGQWTIDLNTILSKDEMENVIAVTDGDFDKQTGIVTLTKDIDALLTITTQETSSMICRFVSTYFLLNGK